MKTVSSSSLQSGIIRVLMANRQVVTITYFKRPEMLLVPLPRSEEEHKRLIDQIQVAFEKSTNSE